MKVLGDFFRSLDWWTLVPDQKWSSALWPPGRLAAARSANRDWAIVYLPAGGAVTVDAKAVTAGDRARVSWFNPADGASRSAGAAAPSYTAPEGWPDAVLVMDGQRDRNRREPSGADRYQSP